MGIIKKTSDGKPVVKSGDTASAQLNPEEERDVVTAKPDEVFEQKEGNTQ